MRTVAQPKASKRRPPGPVVLALVAALVTGCHNNNEVGARKPPAISQNARLRVALQTNPSVVRQMDVVTFTVRLSDAHGRPIEGAHVRADLVMPTMDMGRNPVVTRTQGPGAYVGSGRFSMDGDWDVVVTATRGVDKTIQAFPVHVR